jgi:hypothetical protein
MSIRMSLVFWVAAMITVQTVMLITVVGFSYKYVPLMDAMKAAVESDVNRLIVARFATDGQVLLQAAVPAVEQIAKLCTEAGEEHLLTRVSKLTDYLPQAEALIVRLRDIVLEIDVNEVNATLHTIAVDLVPRLKETMDRLHLLWT